MAEKTIWGIHEGIHPGTSNRNGRWHGPFINFADAEKAAKGTGRPISLCKLCEPH